MMKLCKYDTFTKYTLYFWLLCMTLLVNIAITQNQLISISNHAGNLTFSVNDKSYAKTWRIRPVSPSAVKIGFVFNFMSVGAVELNIYDTSMYALGQVLYACVASGCQPSLPPIFYSNTGDVSISVTSSTYSAGSGFPPSTITLQYNAVTAEYGASASASTLYLNMGYGHLAPNLVNGNMAQQSSQKWIFNLPNKVLISFSQFELSATGNTELYIYDTSPTALNITSPQLIFFANLASHVPTKWLYIESGKGEIVFRNIGNTNLQSNFMLTFYSDMDLYVCGSLLHPDLLQDTSMILTDGSKSSNDMRRDGTSYCTWKIAPRIAHTSVTLIMDWVSIKAGTKIIVYDSNREDKSKILWDGAGPSFTIPPPMTSSGSELLVYFKGDTSLGNGYKGFAGRYTTNYAGSRAMGSGSTLLAMSSAVNLIPPGNGLNYTSNLTYTWYIAPNAITGNITLVFSSLDIDIDDTISIYDGDLSGNILLFSGRQMAYQWIISSSPSVTVVFDSKPSSGDGLSKLGNFKLSYFADGPNYHCGFPSNPGFADAPSMIITDGSSSLQSLYSMQHCEWTISPVNCTAIVLYFTRFDVFGGEVRIYNGSAEGSALIATISNTSVTPPPIFLSSSTIGISYVTSATATGYGFSAIYYGVSSNYVGPGNGMITLEVSSMILLTVTDSGNSSSQLSTIPPNQRVTWVILANNSIGMIYVSFSYIQLTGGDYLELRDGDSDHASLLGIYDGNSLPLPPQWINTTGNSLTVNFVSDNDNSNVADFGLSFYSDGPNSNCGIIGNPGILKAPSMVFTDGSSSNDLMYSNQYCEWLISPMIINATIVLELTENDLVGGVMEVYDGSIVDNDALLWSCNGCTVIPTPIFGHSSRMLVRFSTAGTGVTKGRGFKATYWSLVNASEDWSQYRYTQQSTVLELPNGVQLNTSNDNTSTTWNLFSARELSKLLFYPVTNKSHESSTSGSFNSLDGRKFNDSLFYSSKYSSDMCGILSSKVPATLNDEGFSLQASRYSSSYIDPLTKSKYVISNRIDAASSVQSTDLLHPARVCKYFIDSTSPQSPPNTPVVIQIRSMRGFSQGSAGRLSVFYGLYGYEHLQYDSASDIAVPVNITAPCGKATILIELTDDSLRAVDGTLGIEIYFSTPISYDNGQCNDYLLSLLPVVKKENPYIIYYIIFATFMGIAVLYYPSILLLRKLRYVKFPSFKLPTRKVQAQLVTAQHPKYTPRMDRLRNRFLPTGLCYICRDDGVRIFRLNCNHGLCYECIKGFLDSALGDIAQFPVKCPMHYEGCPGNLDSKIAKRILSFNLYVRFLEFSDRAVYGEGMRCIFCSNYVIYPSEGAAAVVECPYCYQRFCIRCKKPWHYRGKCPLDNVDDSLDKWKKNSGAQTCPCCRKLIEKDDPSTCNHMVHKITDGIPCIRDRTDFCYMCGCEVTQDYPHEEVNNAGVNHFPDGVFQTCRIIVFKQKEIERKRLVRLNRAKNKGKSRGITEISFPYSSPSAAVTPYNDNDEDDEWEDINDFPDLRPGISSSGNSNIVGGDLFDQTWNRVMNQ